MGWRQRFEDRPLVMGILNVTPDSFYDGGKFYLPEPAVEHALRLAAEGADIIDVGAESTRPYADPTPLDEELRRVIPVISAIRERSDAFLSIDTYKAAVAREAIGAGADMINDISGLTFDPELAAVAAQSRVPVIIMHTAGKPKEMQVNPHYDDVVGEIKRFFADRIGYANRCGIDDSNIVLDPGIGFGKRVEDNLMIIKELCQFKDFGCPVLIGTSMKGFLGKLAGSPEPEERIEGTLASIALSVWNGADIVRVHDVKKARKVVTFVRAVMTA